MPLPTRLTAPARTSLLQVLKVSVAVIAAWLLTQLLLSTQVPLFAAIAALLVVQPSVNQSLGKGIERSVGVLLGVLIATVIGAVFGESTAIVLIAIVLSLFVGWALRLTPGFSNQIPISAMLVLALGAEKPEYAIDRIIETVIGAVIGIIVNLLIVPPVLVSPAHEGIARFGNEIAATIERLAGALRTPTSGAQLEVLLLEGRLLRPMADKSRAALDTASESLQFNPRAGRARAELAHDEEIFERLRPLVTRVLGMTRALRDHDDETLHREPTVGAIATELDRAAHDLRILVARFESRSDDTPAATAETPALTAPLVIARPHPEHWILIGSLMEDLRRIREEIIGEE